MTFIEHRLLYAYILRVGHFTIHSRVIYKLQYTNINVYMCLYKKKKIYINIDMLCALYCICHVLCAQELSIVFISLLCYKHITR